MTYHRHRIGCANLSCTEYEACRPKVTFNWSSVPAATGYALRLGTTTGGNNLYGSGEVTATSKTVANLPTNGETIYARRYTYFGTSQLYTDYNFTTAP